MIGTSLGPYKIIEQLGAGGMGEVYLGEDTRLGRKVAIKVLPEEYASDPERLARFEQEARAAAALNHPHIAVVHDVGSETGDDGTITHFMVQEYLEGDTLREPLKKGALPLAKALDLATEIAEALAAAHDAGIVHRDLKPENIFITKEGHAKVLDFGLAKLMEMAPAMSPGTEASKSPTMMGTVAGQVMGTAGYMAPEQVVGDGEIDHRADVFAFGTVLYEMVSGRQAFAGRNVLDTLGRIVDQDPDSLLEADPRLPAEMQRIIKKSLAKEPAKRYQAAGELVIDLQALGADVESGTALPVGGPPVVAPVAVETARGISWKLAAPVGVGLVLVAVLATWLATRPVPQPPVRFDLLVEGGIFSARGTSVVLSPDGARIAYVLGSAGAVRELMIRSLDQQDSTSLVAAPGNPTSPYHPFFSPDGQWVGFVTLTEMKKVPVTGGTPLPITQVAQNRGADWGDPTRPSSLRRTRRAACFWCLRTAASPSPSQSWTKASQPHRWPQFLPGGKAVLFTSHVAGSNFDAATIEVVDLDTKERKVVHRGGTYGRYVPTGHLVYANAGTLFAMPFDLVALEATGSAAPVVENVTTSSQGGAQFGFSETGMLAYRQGTAATSAPEFTLTWVDREGNTDPLSFEPRGYSRPRISPEEDRIAVQIVDAEGTHIWILDIETSTSQLLTFEGTNRYAVWSPDGEWVYFDSDRGGNRDIWKRRTDLSADAEPVYQADGSQFPYSISGTVLLFADQGAGSWDIQMLRIDGDSEPMMLEDTGARTVYPWISPDGRLFAFDSDETGSNQIHVREIETGSRRTISMT